MGRLAVIRQKFLQLYKTSPRLAVYSVVIGLAGLLLIVGGITHMFRQSRFTQLIKNDGLYVSTDVVDGYEQVYYDYENVRVYVTDSKVNHSQPAKSKNYIVWVENNGLNSQLVLYDLLTKSTQTIARSGNNLRPNIYDNRIVWEKWYGSTPMIYYFDGIHTQRIKTPSGTAVRPVLNKDQIAYAVQDENGAWKSVVQDVLSGEVKVVAEGDESIAWPHFYQDKLFTKIDEEFIK